MPKYLLEVSYTAEGAKGLLKDGGTKRRAAAEAAIKSVGGSIESFYFALGDVDVYTVIEAPDHASVVAATVTISAAGGATVKTIALMTPADVDQAVKKNPTYTPPGR